MAFQTNKSVMAVVAEVTEGTPVLPTAASQYVALQEGFDMAPAFETLESAELTGSIGSAKSIQGIEAPTASVDHYVKHSGVEGSEPENKLLLKGAFGASSVASTEYDTVAASTVSVIKVNTGEGATFERGEALLIKDGTNGYKIRPILSISGDDLTLGFKLPTGAAPASGVNLGKAILYKPSESHPTFTAWMYQANGGAIQAVAGNKITSMSLDATTKKLINASFEMEGISYYFNPVNITATDTKLDFFDGTNRVATVTAKLYKDPKELAEAIQTSMNAQGSADTFTVSYSDSDGKYTIATSGATLSLKWNTGANAANTVGDKIGFVTASDDTGATTYTSDNAYTLTAPQTGTYDSSNPLVAKYNEVLLGDSSDADPACLSAQSISFSMDNTKTNILDICAESGVSGSVISKRAVSVDIVATLSAYEVEKFKRFRTNQSTSFLYNFGSKSGGNWEAGKSGCLYIPTCTISSFKVSDGDGLVTLEMTLTAFVASGAGEVYLNFV
jgi:hypothetical protein